MQDCRAAACLQDGNIGLVKLVLAGRTKRAIQKLTQTFLTLSLADIAQQVGLQDASEAEGHILRYMYYTMVAVVCLIAVQLEGDILLSCCVTGPHMPYG